MAATAGLALYLFIDSMVRTEGVPYYLIFLTNWSAMALSGFVILDVIALRKAHAGGRAEWSMRDGLADGQDKPEELAVWAVGEEGGEPAPPPLFVDLLWFVKPCALVSQIMVTLLYWVLLYNPAYPIKARSVLSHGGLCLLALANFFLLQRYTCNHARDVLNLYIFSLP